MPAIYRIVFKCDLCDEEFVDDSYEICRNLMFHYSMLPQGWTAISDDSGEKIYCPNHKILIHSNG